MGTYYFKYVVDGTPYFICVRSCSYQWTAWLTAKSWLKGKHEGKNVKVFYKNYSNRKSEATIFVPFYWTFLTK